MVLTRAVFRAEPFLAASGNLRAAPWSLWVFAVRGPCDIEKTCLAPMRVALAAVTLGL